jgi:hypothetical protein
MLDSLVGHGAISYRLLAISWKLLAGPSRAYL